jgi:predicted metal-dependent hydrolase
VAHPALVAAQRLVDAHDPYAAHEVLEEQWKATSGEERDFWRGVTQAVVALEHAKRGNEVGHARLRERAAITLEPYAGQVRHGVDVDALRAALRDGSPLPPLA